jgi:hypothetical protein
MKIKTQDLTGTALDWAVAKCAGVPVEISNGGWWVFDSDTYPKFRNAFSDSKWQTFFPSITWSQAGVIIEREGMSIGMVNEFWQAHLSEFGVWQDGPTPLVAAMRCYVASKMGDEVEVPDEVAA